MEYGYDEDGFLCGEGVVGIGDDPRRLDNLIKEFL